MIPIILIQKITHLTAKQSISFATNFFYWDYHNINMRISGFTKFYIAFILFNFIFTPVILFINGQSKIENQNGFVSSAIESTAGIVAIVFAISILVIQHAASNYTPSVLSNFKDDIKFWFTLAYGIFTIIFLSMSLVLDWAIFLLNLFYFANTLGLLSIFFLYTFEKINPLSIVRNIENEIIQECKNISKILKKKITNNKIANKASTNPTETYKYAAVEISDVLSHSILKNNPELFEKIKTSELTLRQIISASVKKGDHDTSRASFDVYPVIFENYLKIIPNYLWTNDEFLLKLLDDLKSYAVVGMHNNNKLFLEDLFETLKKSGLVFVKNISTFDNGFDSNLYLGLCVDYLNEFGVNLLVKEEYDLTANTIRSMGTLGQASCTKYHHDHMVIEYILNIANSVMVKKDPYIPVIAMHESFRIIRELIKTLSQEYAIKKNIQRLSNMLEKFEESKIQTMSMNGGFTDITDNGVIPCVHEALQVKNDEYEQIQTPMREEFEKMVIKSLIELVGKFGRSAKKYGDVLIANTCADCLTTMALLIATQKFTTIEKGHEEDLRSIISWLATLTDNQNQTTLNDTGQRISEVIFCCYVNDYNDVSEKGIEIVYKMAQDILEKYDIKYAGLKILESLDLIGCYGIASGKEEISIKIANVYLDFVAKYEEKFKEKPRDTSSLHKKYSLREYEMMRVKFHLRKTISQILTPENGQKFEDIKKIQSEIRKKSD